MLRGPCRLLRSIFRLAYWKPTCSRLATLRDRRACLSNSHCALCRRFCFARDRTETYFRDQGPSAPALSVRAVRGEAAGRFVWVPIRLRLATIAAVRARPCLAGRYRRKSRSVRRPRNQDPPSPLYRIRRRGRHRLAPRQAPFRTDIRSFARIPHASFGSANPPASHGIVSRSMPNLARST